jgi:hypothetical protein
MAEYQKVIYRIGKDGKITETVVGATGPSCQKTTETIEKALGQITAQDLLPEYYQESQTLNSSNTQTLGQDYKW